MLQELILKDRDICGSSGLAWPGECARTRACVRVCGRDRVASSAVLQEHHQPPYPKQTRLSKKSEEGFLQEKSVSIFPSVSDQIPFLAAHLSTCVPVGPIPALSLSWELDLHRRCVHRAGCFQTPSWEVFLSLSFYGSPGKTSHIIS